MTALVVQGRLLAFQDTGGRGNGEYMIDDATKVPVVASGETDALEPLRSFALTTDFVWSWSHVNLRAGVTYGNVSLPMLNFVAPEKIIFPNLDFYVRFRQGLRPLGKMHERRRLSDVDQAIRAARPLTCGSARDLRLMWMSRTSQRRRS